MPNERDPTASALGRWTARARSAAKSLKDEYEAGKRGDDAPATPIWATPAEQLDGAVRLVRAAGERITPPAGDADVAAATAAAADTATEDTPRASADGAPASEAGRTDEDGSASDGSEHAGDAAPAGDVCEVAGALRRVDWTSVRTATADRTSEAGHAARTLAAQVDWARVQPTARRVSAALIGAVASGQIGIGGPLGPLVARAIVDQGGFGRQVEDRLEADATALPPDLTDVIETTAREEPS